MLLSDVLVFLQEKDQKYVFASLVSWEANGPTLSVDDATSSHHTGNLLRGGWPTDSNMHPESDAVLIFHVNVLVIVHSVMPCVSQDQRSTVISIQKLIVREVANEERGLYTLNLLLEHLINKPKSLIK